MGEWEEKGIMSVSYYSKGSSGFADSQVLNGTRKSEKAVITGGSVSLQLGSMCKDRAGDRGWGILINTVATNCMLLGRSHSACVSTNSRASRFITLNAWKCFHNRKLWGL